MIDNVKIIVIDDDPTGTQTVSDVSVYTRWDKASLMKGFLEDNKMFYILSNSRSLSEMETARLHREIAGNILAVSRETGKEFLLISRGDSTLRGHYPLETECLRERLEEGGIPMDGEIIMPFFPEGGRFTAADIHYATVDGKRIPVGETEFAKDKTFGYKSSDLKEWIEEKTNGLYKKEKVLSITLDMLRPGGEDNVAEALMGVRNFGKVIVNAQSYGDVSVFRDGFLKAYTRGKRFLFRSAAALPKILGEIPDRELLKRKDMIHEDNKNGGLIIVGSHVKRTTEQLEQLNEQEEIVKIEFNQHLVLDSFKPDKLMSGDLKIEKEIERIAKLCNYSLANGNTVVVYTKRDRIDVNTGSREDELKMAVKISDCITQIVKQISVKPSFIVAKGGITSSDVATKGLGVIRASVIGQIRPGIPVWRTGQESRFPDIPYVVFPGNAGGKGDLKYVAEILGNTEKPVIAVLLGDGSGVGPEIVAKLAVKGVLTETARPVIIGDRRVFSQALKLVGKECAYQVFESMEQVNWDQGLPLISLGLQNPDDFQMGQVNGICGQACLDMIEYAVGLYKNKRIDGVCYAPLNKGAMKRAGCPAASETELFALLLGQPEGFGEINMLDDVWTTRVTSHIPLKDISSHLTVQAIETSIDLADSTLRRAGYEDPQIGVCALNPHGGEGGLCGLEEMEVIAPAVSRAKTRGIRVSGPYPADTLFKQAFDGKFHAIVTMFHDQGQIALKLKGFERGITIGGGLHIPVTTCAHGTAHDIAGRGIAAAESMERAFRMVCVMAK